MKKCKLCYSSDLTLVYSNVTDLLFNANGEYSYYTCENCGIINMYENSEHYFQFEQYTKEYSARKKLNTKNILKNAIRRLMIFVGDDKKMSLFNKLLRKYLGCLTGVILLSNREKMGVFLSNCKKNKLLDIGCGSGDYILFMEKVGWDVTGIEVSEHSVQICRENGLNVFHLSIDNFSSRDVFDVITLRHVIEHISDPISFLSTTKKLLNSDGKLFIITPNFDSYNSYLYKKNWLGLDVSRHEVIYNRKSLEYLVNSINMKVEFVSVTNRISRFVIYASEMRSVGLNPYKNFNFIILIKSYIKSVSNKITGKNGDEIFMVVSNPK